MNTQPVQQEPEVQVASVPTTSPTSQVTKQLASLSAAILLICFFFPWFNLLFVGVSGFMLGNEAGWIKIVWAMPVLALISLIAGLAGQSQQGIGQLAGVSPFAFLIYALVENGAGFFQVILPGGWLALGAGAALFIFARK